MKIKNNMKAGIILISLLILNSLYKKSPINFDMIIALIYVFLFSYIYKKINSKLIFGAINTIAVAVFFFGQDSSLTNLPSDLMFIGVFSVATYLLFVLTGDVQG